MKFNTVIVTRNGRFYRFNRQENGQLECQVCYWKGIVIPPDGDANHFRAYVEQKYAPYQQLWAEGVLKSESEALNWVAEGLKHDEAPEEK